MNTERFEYLLRLVGPHIKKRDMVTALSPAQRLAMTLRLLAAGDSQEYSLSFAYRCAQSTVSVILAETTGAIVAELKSLVLKVPLSEQEWRDIASGFWEEWQFPHCVGAIDGKHIQVQAPQASQSVYFNYKKNFSIVLLAVCDSSYNFTVIDLGAEGSLSDGALFNSSELGLRLSENSPNLPEASNLSGVPTKMPYFLVGDAAFPLKKYLRKPYTGKNIPHECAVYNYRLSRARRVIENSFGILAARWRIFRRPIIGSTDNIAYITEAAVCLHNFIRKTGNRKVNAEYCPPNFVDSEEPDGQIIPGDWRDIIAGKNGAIIRGPRRLGAMNAAKKISDQRDSLKDFVNGPAALPFQDALVRLRQGLIMDDNELNGDY